VMCWSSDVCSSDLRFCHNAKKAGAKLVSVPALKAIHNGLPCTLRQFFDREAWHGRGDWTTVQTILTTKVAVLTLAFLCFHLAFLVTLFFLPKFWIVTLGTLVAIGGICAGSSLIKFGRSGWVHVLFNTLIYYVYFFARTVSLFSVLVRSEARKHERA